LRGSRQDKVAQVLDWGLKHEDTLALRYLSHSYTTRNREVKSEMEGQALKETQHLGWLSQELVGTKGGCRIEHSTLHTCVKTADMLRADIEVEKKL